MRCVTASPRPRRRPVVGGFRLPGATEHKVALSRPVYWTTNTERRVGCIKTGLNTLLALQEGTCDITPFDVEQVWRRDLRIRNLHWLYVLLLVNAFEERVEQQRFS